ncbi:MAG TPA: hypothetical protein VG735_15285 [Caulobacterales bacterium]|nr:hypothetical protein [Caulobacterales bacterium]
MDAKFWWPEINNLADAKEASRAGSVAAGFKAFFSVMMAGASQPVFNWFLSGAFVLFAGSLTWLIWAFQSRAAAVIVLIWSVAEFFALWFFAHGGGLLFLEFIIGSAALAGVRGTFAYHRLKRAHDRLLLAETTPEGI